MEKLRIWLLDDVQATNYIHTKYLRQTLGSVEVRSFQKGQEALQSLQNLKEHAYPHLFFVDINMPSMNAWTFFQKWIERSLPIPGHMEIYILTTSVTPTDRNRMQNFEFVRDVLYKPLQPAVIRKVFEAYTEQVGAELRNKIVLPEPE